MAFSESGLRFQDEMKFNTGALNFAAKEMSRFTDPEEDASAKVDRSLSAAASFLANKQKQKKRAYEKARKEEKERSRENKEERKVRSADRSREVSLETSQKKKPDNDKAVMGRGEKKGQDSGKSTGKKGSKESSAKNAKGAAVLLAVSKMLEMRAEMKNDLKDKDSSGHALKDGNSGAVKVLTMIFSPRTYFEILFSYLMTIATPYILLFIAYMLYEMLLFAVIINVISAIPFI